MPDYDEVLETVGEFGKWQKILFLWVCVPSAASAMAVFMYSFIAFTPDHRCAIRACNDTAYSPLHPDFIAQTIPKDGDGWSQCSAFQFALDSDQCPPANIDKSKTTKCPDGWVYDDTLFPVTAATEMNMVCGDDWQNSFSQSMYMVGMLVGSFIFGFFADQYGRKLALVVSSALLAVSGSLSALLPATFPLFATLRLLSGMGHVGVFMMAFTLSVEYVGPASRVMTGCLIEVPFSVGKQQLLNLK